MALKLVKVLPLGKEKGYEPGARIQLERDLADKLISTKHVEGISDGKKDKKAEFLGKK